MKVPKTIRRIYYRINWQFVFIFSLISLFILFEFTNIEYVFENSFSLFFKYIVMPILFIGSLMVFRDSTKGIFKKDALSSGVFIYFLWWVWVVVVILFAFAIGATIWKTYFN